MRSNCLLAPMRFELGRARTKCPSDLVICPSLDLIHRSMSDYVIHSTATLSARWTRYCPRVKARGSLAPAQPVLCILDNIDPLAKLAAKK
jgi:hypothetical protein